MKLLFWNNITSHVPIPTECIKTETSFSKLKYLENKNIFGRKIKLIFV